MVLFNDGDVKKIEKGGKALETQEFLKTMLEHNLGKTLNVAGISFIIAEVCDPFANNGYSIDNIRVGWQQMLRVWELPWEKERLGYWGVVLAGTKEAILLFPPQGDIFLVTLDTIGKQEVREVMFP